MHELLDRVGRRRTKAGDPAGQGLGRQPCLCKRRRHALKGQPQSCLFGRIEHMAGGATGLSPRQHLPGGIAGHPAAGRAAHVEAEIDIGHDGTPWRTNMRVISRGLVIMVPTTTAWAPAAKADATSSGRL